MRREYDFSQGRRFREVRGRGERSATEDLDPLTQRQIREIRRRVAESDDPTRYIVVAGFGPRFQLYYNVEDDAYIMNEPKRATLFKRRQLAAAAARLLGQHIGVVKCTTRRRGGERVLVVNSISVTQHRLHGRRLTRA